MRNISAVITDLGRAHIKGYLPAKHSGSSIEKRLATIIEEISGKQGVPTAEAPPPMVFFNIGWMKKYAGAAQDDPTRGRHGYLVGRTHGAESFNFAPKRGKVFGYRPGFGRKVNINELGAATKDDHISGVLVVWIAMEPTSKKAFIVGWYRNATVYRSAQPSTTLKGNIHPGMDISYTAETEALLATLLPEPNRDFWVQSNKTMDGGFGQSIVWYGRDDEYRSRVWKYISEVEKEKARLSTSSTKKTRPPRNLDPELRRKVEKAAIAHATKHFKSTVGGGYTVESVESLARGWDLEASRNDGSLFIEVKGLHGPKGVCELTPNEYGQFINEDVKRRYIVYIVNHALSANPIASVFRYDSNEHRWKTADGRVLHINVRPGAVLRFD
ncbi:DUF3883 domain-containing protein [Phyllobacterium sp. CCNWLW109]|uniref:protein NO VEIN domain-containing protein n=1 Tax=Phyllobacterium sp. CCNWLW109 TaxID=3127479 RepID=UPI003076B1C7